MKSFDSLRDETNALHFDFLLLEVSIASTFLDVVQTTQIAETRTRNLRNAEVAYSTILRLKSRVAMTEQQTMELQEKLLALRRKMDSLARLGNQ